MNSKLKVNKKKKNMLQKNKYCISEIAELTQLSEEDVERIAQELKNSTENTK